MARVETSILVNVPLWTAYNQWTQFEEFPRFMEGVEEVRQLDDKRLYWRARIGGKIEEWTAEIIEQTPGIRIGWQSTMGAQNAGSVAFDVVSTSMTQVILAIEYSPQSAVEQIGDMVGVVSRRVEGDLQRFKEFIESRGHETGAWRGEIHGKAVSPDTLDRVDPAAMPVHQLMQTAMRVGGQLSRVSKEKTWITFLRGSALT